MTGPMPERLERWPDRWCRRCPRGCRWRLPLDPGRCGPAGRVPPHLRHGTRDRRLSRRVRACSRAGRAAAGELDVLFLATDAAISREIVAGPGRAVPLIIDNSSAFRLDRTCRWSCPRPTPRPARPFREPGRQPQLHDRRSGRRPGPDSGRRRPGLRRPGELPGGQWSGPRWPRRLPGGARRRDREPAVGSPFHGRIADSVVPQIDVLAEDGWTGEERKIHAEIRKILDLPGLDVAGYGCPRPRQDRPQRRVALPHAAHASVRHPRGRPAQGSGPRISCARRIQSATPCRSTSRGAIRSSLVAYGPSRAETAAFACFLTSDNLERGLRSTPFRSPRQQIRLVRRPRPAPSLTPSRQRSGARAGTIGLSFASPACRP